MPNFCANFTMLFNEHDFLERFNACAAHGGSVWDHSAMVRALEKMANFELGAKHGAQDQP
jgi:hydroxypyruvate isomerase